MTKTEGIRKEIAGKKIHYDKQPTRMARQSVLVGGDMKSVNEINQHNKPSGLAQILYI